MRNEKQPNYTLDEAELGDAPVTAEGQKIRAELARIEPLSCCADGCRCQCICRREGGYAKDNAKACLAAELDHRWKWGKECEAAAFDEKQLLANLEALRDSPWLAACPGELGDIILNRAIAVTRDRQRRAAFTADYEDDMHFRIIQMYLADPDSELWQKLFGPPRSAAAS